jgi:uroporphyrinogen-III synthase/uroporphyrinogen III methyltransferase/synthase
VTTPPLTGRRILVTRAATQAGKLSDGLRTLGAIPIEVPVLEIQPPLSCDALDRSLQQLASYHWLILTSTNAVRAVADRASHLGISWNTPAPPQVAAVGRATAEEAERAGLAVALIPEAYVAESLVSELAPRIAGQRVLLARAAVARDVIPDALRAAGAVIDVVDAYRNAMPAAAPAQLRAALEKGIDAATFTSSSSVTHLADAATAAGIAFPFAGVPAISIGPITSQTLREHNWSPAAEASPHDIPGLIAAVASLFRERAGCR